MNTVKQIAGFILLVSFTGFVFGAANSNDPPKRVVSYADLNLSHKAGAETLLFRIKSAAREVCEPQLNRELGAGRRYRQCIDEAIARAVADVQAPVLAAVYRETPVR
jgi:UrcA family protein